MLYAQSHKNYIFKEVCKTVNIPQAKYLKAFQAETRAGPEAFSHETKARMRWSRARCLAPKARPRQQDILRRPRDQGTEAKATAVSQ